MRPTNEPPVGPVDPVEPVGEPVVEPVRPWTRWQNWGNVLLGAWLFISPWVLNFANGAGTYNETGGCPGVGANGTGVATACNSNPWNAWIVGAIIFLVALWALAAPLTQWPEWINMAAGVWLFISPWVLGFAYFNNNNGNNAANTGAESWNAWIVGAVVFFLALWALIKVRQAQNETGNVVGFLPGRPRRPVNP